MNNTYVPWYN